MIKKPAFAARCLKLVFTYLTGILDFTLPFLPVFLKNKIIKPLPMLPTTKSAEKEESEFDLINLKLDSESRFDDVKWDRIPLENSTNMTGLTHEFEKVRKLRLAQKQEMYAALRDEELKFDTSENSIPKRIKHEIDTVEYGIKKYVNEIGVYVNETGAYSDITSQSVRPSSLKFNDSGISDIGSSANSVASTPEIEQNNAAINDQQAINQKLSGNQKSKRKNRKSRNRANSVNKQKEVAIIQQSDKAIMQQKRFIEQNDLVSGPALVLASFNQKPEFQNFVQNSILNTGFEKIDLEQKTDNEQHQNLEQTIGQKYQIPERTQQQAADCKKTSQQTSDINCNAQPNILFDLPLLSTPDENSDEEVDEELEKFKMYCQETNKLFILNDSKIVIEWENM